MSKKSRCLNKLWDRHAVMQWDATWKWKQMNKQHTVPWKILTNKLLSEHTHCERKHIYGLFISNLKTWTTKEEICTYYKYYKKNKNINKTLAEETDEIGEEQTWDPELIYCFLNFRGLGYLGILYHSLHMAHFTDILVDMLNM